jgi:environmental stress-induced protein Ves
MRVTAWIAAEDVAPQRWRNGGGWTRELLAWPAPPAAWRLRISLATIDAAGPFSVFPGVQRALALVSGAGLLLSIDGRAQRLHPGSEPVFFAGTAAVAAEPLAGPSIDLNLMTAAGRGEMLPIASAGRWTSPCPQRGLFSAVAGTLESGDESLALAPGSFLWMDEAAGVPLRFVPATPAASATTHSGAARAAAPAPLGAWWLGYAPA